MVEKKEPFAEASDVLLDGAFRLIDQEAIASQHDTLMFLNSLCVMWTQERNQ